MQLKGLVKFFTAALIVFSLWRLSFTFITHNVENKIEAQAEQQLQSQYGTVTDPMELNFHKEQLVQNITDSMRGENVVDFLGMKYTFQEVKEKELQLGLDLQGGMSVTLEVELKELIKSLSRNPNDVVLEKTIEETERLRLTRTDDYAKLFGEAYQNVNPGGRLATLFVKASNTGITQNSTNEEVITMIRKEAKDAINRTYNVINQRVDRFGVASPTIQLNENRGMITVELAGVKDPESVRNVLQATAQLQFWEVATNLEMAQYLMNADKAVENYNKSKKSKMEDPVIEETSMTEEDPDAIVAQTDTEEESGSLESLTASGDESVLSSTDDYQGLFTKMSPIINTQTGSFEDATIVGAVSKSDAAEVLELLNSDLVRAHFPKNIKFLVGEYPGLSASEKNKPTSPQGIYAIKTIPGTDEAKLEGDRVRNARFDVQQTGQAEISLEMDQQGSSLWARLTRDNIGKPIAITLDNYVYSAPIVQNEITGGRSSITGNFSIKEGTDLANILQTGKLPAPAKIVQEQIIGPTLGQESISGGQTAFLIAFAVIFVLMIVYYNTGGIVASIALALSMFFTFGILASLGATLTMAGIAGIVLGIGMGVDTNVIIFERIKEELTGGADYKTAISNGYRKSYAPVLDAHVTSIITALILFNFGMGPIKGFATTQIITLILSLFTGIMISRLITEMYMKKERHFNYFTKISKRLFQKANYNFVGIRKVTMGIGVVIVLLGIGSYFNGFYYGVEFSGGRSYTIHLDQSFTTEEVREGLQDALEKRPVVKTVGFNNQLNVTTDYLINDQAEGTEEKVLTALYGGMKSNNFIPSDVSLELFQSKYVQSSQTVSPVISEDLKKGALIAATLSMLAIFFYILLRFRRWQYSVGALSAMIHDMAVVLILFSFFKSIVPFSLEIDQHFIAAFLTVMGFSINDTVIIFDRIREYFSKDKTSPKAEVINRAINNTLSRTIMTSVTVLLTALILFIFGGEVLRGFAFAMFIGVLAGSYSSIFIAAPILLDLDKKDKLQAEEDKDARIEALKAQA
ncbi:MAG TPA: protein translocase subunit SecDF [Chitinophagaceae bacterium]|nr:protein translocase subunit SecDF [Chitinophagaceae bacterium]